MRGGHPKKARGESLPLPLEKLYVDQREFYRKIYESSSSPPWENAFDPDWLKQILRELGSAKGKRALDIGAGKGRGCSILASHGYAVAGMDYLFTPLSAAMDLKTAKGKHPVFVNADLFTAPFRDRSFDVALDWGVFHHIRRNDTGKYLQALTRVLKPGAIFLLGCFSTSFRHEGEKKRKRNWLVHKGHYDRFSTKRELIKTFAPLFEIASLKETRPGFYHIVMRLRG